MGCKSRQLQNLTQFLYDKARPQGGRPHLNLRRVLTTLACTISLTWLWPGMGTMQNLRLHCAMSNVLYVLLPLRLFCVHLN